MTRIKARFSPFAKFAVFILILSLSTFLRSYKITSFPPAPYWEEVALGYDAFSIAETGKDHHGNFLPIVAFESFGDWKPSGYFYALVPFIKMFDLEVWVVRLPSMISGILLVVMIGKLAQLLYEIKPVKDISSDLVFFIASFITAISPWAIQFSRAGWEVNLATFLLTTGLLLGLSLIKNLDNVKRSSLVSTSYQLIFFIPTVLLLIMAAYTYHSARVLAPLLGAGIIWLWFQVQLGQDKAQCSVQKIRELIKKRWQVIVITGFLAGFLFSPILASLSGDKINQRFAETSIFSELSVIEDSNFLKNSAGNTWISRIIFHRYILFGREIAKNFLDHFSLDFLFISGDANPRHSTGMVGELYHIEILFLFLGFIWIIKNWNKYHLFLLFWLAVGILPAALTKTTPHALRILPVMPVFIIIVSLGIVEFATSTSSWWVSLNKRFKSNKMSIIIISLSCIFFVYLLELSYFWRFYSKVYPKVASSHWQYGYNQMIEKVVDLQENNPDLPVYITREQGRPAMYYWFYTKTNPQEVQRINNTARQDQGEFLEFNNIKFIDNSGEITQRPAIMASSSEMMDEIISYETNSKLKNSFKMESLDGEGVWEVGVVE